jgi:hypothetical protein
MQVPFDLAQGRLSTPLKYASLRMTIHLFERDSGDRTFERFLLHDLSFFHGSSGARRA